MAPTCPILRRGVSGMNTEQISKPSVTTDGSKFSRTILLEELVAIGTPIGTFADATDIVLRIRNGKPIAANAGGQGGGQN
jgi:hypothetical protein